MEKDVQRMVRASGADHAMAENVGPRKKARRSRTREKFDNEVALVSTGAVGDYVRKCLEMKKRANERAEAKR